MRKAHLRLLGTLGKTPLKNCNGVLLSCHLFVYILKIVFFHIRILFRSPVFRKNNSPTLNITGKFIFEP